MAARKRRYRLYPRARADLEEIWLYTLQAWSLDLQKIVEEIDQKHLKLVRGKT